MNKNYFENEIYKTEIIDKKDFVVIRQLVKITGIEHKVLLKAEELEVLGNIKIRD